MPLTLRLDPWTPTYESAFQIEEDEGNGSPAEVDPYVECAVDEWRPRLPEFVDKPDTIAFVDGVQRVEMRVIGDNNGRTIYGAFASVAVGTVLVREGHCAVDAELPLRVLALSDGETHPAISVPCGEATLEFQPQFTGESGLPAVQQAVQNAREREEFRLGETLADASIPLVVVDGRLHSQPKSSRMVGLIKTIHRRYLPDAELETMSQLNVGMRTPIFRLAGKHPMYSWYIRLSQPRPFDHAWSGIVRLETIDSIPLEDAVRIANLTACYLPQYASEIGHDPRAPQNLYPIRGLEDQLHHSLGDHEWIRRHIEVHFSLEAMARR